MRVTTNVVVDDSHSINTPREREREREREKEIRTATTVIQPTDSIKMNSKLTVYITLKG